MLGGLGKYLPLSAEAQRAAVLDERADLGLPQDLDLLPLPAAQEPVQAAITQEPSQDPPPADPPQKPARTPRKAPPAREPGDEPEEQPSLVEPASFGDETSRKKARQFLALAMKDAGLLMDDDRHAFCLDAYGVAGLTAMGDTDLLALEKMNKAGDLALEIKAWLSKRGK